MKANSEGFETTVKQCQEVKLGVLASKS